MSLQQNGPDDSRSADGLAPHATGGDAQLDRALGVPFSRDREEQQLADRRLEKAVCTVVDELRARGLGPEKVLAILKSHVSACAANPERRRRDVLRWFIARYYDGASARPAPDSSVADGA